MKDGANAAKVEEKPLSLLNLELAKDLSDVMDHMLCELRGSAPSEADQDKKELCVLYERMRETRDLQQSVLERTEEVLKLIKVL